MDKELSDILLKDIISENQLITEVMADMWNVDTQDWIVKDIKTFASIRDNRWVIEDDLLYLSWNILSVTQQGDSDKLLITVNNEEVPW